MLLNKGFFLSIQYTVVLVFGIHIIWVKHFQKAIYLDCCMTLTLTLGDP